MNPDTFAWPDDGKQHYGVPNPQYDPRVCGLEIVASFSEPDLGYEFNDWILWRHIGSGEYYCASDSGCSCPMPFERYTSLSSLTRCATLADALREFDAWNKGYDKRPLVDSFAAHTEIESKWKAGQEGKP